MRRFFKKSSSDEGRGDDLPSWQRDGYSVKMSQIARVLIYDDDRGSIEFTCDIEGGRWTLDDGAIVEGRLVRGDDTRVAQARSRTQEFLSAQQKYYPDEKQRA